MSTTLHILGSGSSGNAALVRHGDFGLLIDCGLSSKELGVRLAQCGCTWADVNLVVLTHTHSDHWNKYALEHLRRAKIPLLAHESHHHQLWAVPAYEPLHRAGLLRTYASDSPMTLADGIELTACAVAHDADPTYALRVQFGGRTLGWATDLGGVDEALLAFLTGVHVLGLEFNHDVPMQRTSRRPKFLIDRVLGDYGHLSNEQAADALDFWQEHDSLHAVVQLHLSRECNTATLARAAGLQALGPRVTLHTAHASVPIAGILL